MPHDKNVQIVIWIVKNNHGCKFVVAAKKNTNNPVMNNAKLGQVRSCACCVFVSTQVRKSPGPEWDVPIRGQVPELVWDFSYLDMGLILFFSLSRTVRSSEIPLTPYIPQLAIKTIVRKPKIILVLTAMGVTDLERALKQL